MSAEKTRDINSSLLEYYTNLTEHHRTKISVLGGMYLTVSQLMLLTPIKTVEESIGTDKLIFISMLGLIISLLIVGILHHACNISLIATQRLNVLRELYWDNLPEEAHDLTAYSKWRNEFEPKHRDTFSVSRLSLFISIALVLPIFSLTMIRFHTITSLWFKDANQWLVLGIFYASQVFILWKYIVVIFHRSRNFYKVRECYKIVQNAKAKGECLPLLSGVQ